MWGATAVTSKFLTGDRNFNSRSRVGSDLQLIAQPMTAGIISIHAPVWGATFTFELKFDIIKISIHAPVWGATFFDKTFNVITKFQFTLPCGERPPFA